MGGLAGTDSGVNRRGVVWVFLGFGPWSWVYSYYPETCMVRARMDGALDIWRTIADLRCIVDSRIRPAWWRAVKWEVMRIFNRRRIR